ncbi:MAG: hypothetical protein QM536_01360 [Chitinophagaceae bacterium]|nr:hypothetical protein [Chitinophagaceae bacterium]
MISFKKILFTIFIILLTISDMVAQNPFVNFGKSRIRYKNYEWFYYNTDKFDIYFYQEGEDYAKITAEYLKEEFDNITNTLGYIPYTKTQILLYNSIADMQQSNVGLNKDIIGENGETHFLKLVLEIAYPGTMTDFREVLKYKITELLLQDMFFGGTLYNTFQSTYRQHVPKWFIDGLSLSLSKGWSVEMDSYIREFIKTNKRVADFTNAKYSEKEAMLLGQSLWNFIILRYGKNNISNILNLTRINKNYKKSISNTLGLSFKDFLAEWKNFYLTNAADVEKKDFEIPKDKYFIKNKNKNKKITALAFNNTQRYFSYAANNNGRYQVFLYDMLTQKNRVIKRGGVKIVDREKENDIPLIKWVNDSTIGIVYLKKGIYILELNNIFSKISSIKYLERFSKIRNIAFHENGKIGIISGDINGQNDLYLLSVRRTTLRRLTNDLFDDITPEFIPKSDNIIFSSNRNNESLKNNYPSLTTLQNNYNLFLYNLDTTKNTVIRLTNDFGSNYAPKALDNDDFFYISDQKGIVNLYKYNTNQKTYTQIFDNAINFLQYDIQKETNTLAAVVYKNGRERILLYPYTNIDTSLFREPTPRQKYIQYDFVQKRNIEMKEKKRKDSLTSYYFKTSNISKNKETSILQNPLFSGIDGLIDTENYAISEDIIQQRTQSESFLTRFIGTRQKNKTLGPFPYEPRFSTRNIGTTFINEPLRGFGMVIETGMNDLLEDHLFYGGTNIFFSGGNFKNYDFFGEYQYIKHNIDFKTRYDLRSYIFEVENQYSQSYILHNISFEASIPIYNATKITLKPFFTYTRFLELNPNSISTITTNNFSPNQSDQYGGINSEIILDKTIIAGENITLGTKGKVSFTSYIGISNFQKSFHNIEVDIRHYQQIYRELVFATRLFYGNFFGANPKSYLLGGEYGTFFNTINANTPENPLQMAYGNNNSDILFTKFATNLRGFDNNNTNGNQVVFINAELRLPLIRIFTKKYISSKFLRALQITSFYDIGAAWTGASPFEKDNTINTTIFRSENNPFTAVIKSTKHPWNMGYGFGVRTFILGYHIRFDVARSWDGEKSGPFKFYLALGYDF